MTTTPKAPDLLAKAAAHMADRAATYDKPEGERSMGRAVLAFNAITGRDLSEPEGWLLLQVLKDVRLFQRAGYHADSAEDCIAYAALKAEAKAREGVVVADVVAADDGDWIDWHGGKCPVPFKALVYVIYRGHGQDSGQALRFDWGHDNSVEDIIAYRLVSDPDYTGHELHGLCRACKHCYVSVDVDPCKSCLASEEVTSNWEPAEDKE